MALFDARIAKPNSRGRTVGHVTSAAVVAHVTRGGGAGGATCLTL